MKTVRLFFTLVVFAALLLSFASTPVLVDSSAGSSAGEFSFNQNLPTNPAGEKIDPAILEALSPATGEAGGSARLAATDFFIWLADRADLTPASHIATKSEKGQWVYAALHEVVGRSQAPLRSFLDQRGVLYRPFYIVNAILIRNGDLRLAYTLASRADVVRITGNLPIDIPQPHLDPIRPASPADIEPNISFINADDAWALGFTGQGAVLAAIDTGLQWDHPVIIDHYRGWDGAVADHNFNWWDATGQYPTAPADDNGHGTMVTGVMVGGDSAENQIGVAPGAKTIHCKAITAGGGGSTADFLECFQWILAPWDLTGANPDPGKAPDALNNSWGSSDFPGLEAALDALEMAGIVVEASAGGNGPACATLVSPGDYAQVLTTGGVDQTGGVLPGALAWFSGRGPSVHDPSAFIPDVMAPSIDVRSSYPEDDYMVWSGTAVAGAHTTGLVGLVLSANPTLRGNILDTSQVIFDTAVPLVGQPGSNCGGDYVTGPNNDWGYGTIDALAAVQQALIYSDPGTLSGAVTDADTLAPLEGVEIQAAGVIGWITTTNSLGMYSMLVPSGTYTVSATFAGYYPVVITNVTVLANEETLLDVSLTGKPGEISGQVKDGQSLSPLAGVEIRAAGAQDWITTTNSLGQYSLVVPGGTYTISADLEGYYMEVIPGVNVPHDTIVTQDFALQLVQVTITGTVSDANTGDPLAAEIQVSGRVITTTFTDPATGQYLLNVPIGHAYTLTAQSPGYGAVTSGTEVLSGNVQMDFGLPAGWLAVNPLTLSLSLMSGNSLTAPISMTNTGGLTLTYTISRTASWLEVSLSVGILPISSTQVVEVLIDTAILPAPGVYTAILTIHTDTPYGSVQLPVTLTVVARNELFLPLVIHPPW